MKFIQEKPEVIAWIRAQYNEESLPDWVGRFEGDVDYEAVLRQAGVELPYSGDHGGDDSADGSGTDDNGIAEGVPSPQASTNVANHTSSRTVMGGHGKSRTVTHGHPSRTVMEESQNESRTVTEEPPEESRTSHRRSQGRTHHHRNPWKSHGRSHGNPWISHGKSHGQSR